MRAGPPAVRKYPIEEVSPERVQAEDGRIADKDKQCLGTSDRDCCKDVEGELEMKAEE